MIKIHSIRIREFRGIRDLYLEIGCGNYAVCGPNGTGKSGIVDALEFGLTGNVSRISGEGQGLLTLKKHGPHVDQMESPQNASVELEVRIQALKRVVKIVRNANTPSSFTVDPDSKEAREILEAVQRHPEVVLSRRELIRYVLTTPGKRSEEIQALLHLGKVDEVRKSLNRIANSRKRDLGSARSEAQRARANFDSAIGLETQDTPKVLESVNLRRKLLGLPVLSEMTDGTSFRDGIEDKPAGKVVSKTEIKKHVDEIQAHLNSVGEIDFLDLGLRAEGFSNNAELAEVEQRQEFLESGIPLIAENRCPFCEDDWDPVALKEQIEQRVEILKKTLTRVDDLRKDIEFSTQGLRKIIASAFFLKGLLNDEELKRFSQLIHECGTKCEEILSQLEPSKTLKEVSHGISQIKDALGTFSKRVLELSDVASKLPEDSEKNAAAAWLVVAQERKEILVQAERRVTDEEVVLKTAERIAATFSAVADKVLTEIYSNVQREFASIYAAVNQDDEAGFEAKLIPSEGKLELDVDFYGRGYFPPGAFHSEGHQDGMGLCLYLALMRHLQKSAFSFAILDDVLMSVDSGHRREVCRVLKNMFPETQFIVTTHDPVWMRHMRSEGLIGRKQGVQFRKWTLESGPVNWDSRDAWAEIDHELENNNVRAAAGVLRNYLEYLASECCHALRAQVAFRNDALFQLGELLPAAYGQILKYLRKGKEAANSWSQTEVVSRLESKVRELQEVYVKTQADGWAVNSSIHYNNWANLVGSEFRPIAIAFKELMEKFVCDSCGEMFRASPERESAESLRCECGKTNINLKKK